MEAKKISFGFKMTKKLEKPVVEEKKDFIECLEEKSIKVVGGEQVEEEKPLVIPMKPNTLITAERLREIAEKVESGLDEVVPKKEQAVEIKLEPTENETLDQMAVRELLQESKKQVKVEVQELTVPVPAKPVIEGEKESTLDDYESVPIQDFGMAMLRGMGWTENKEKLAKYKPPQLRPKGLGLGADKVISDKQKKKAINKDGKEEDLAIVKNSFVKIIAGKHSGYYGKVVSLDEENGRVMVDITVKKETVSLSEFMMQPVTKSEFDKESKVINSGAYEEYKKKESSQNQKSSRNESPKFAVKQRLDSPKVNDREASSSRISHDVSRDRREIKEESRRDHKKASNGRDKSKQEKSRRNSSSEEENNRRKNEYERDSSSVERDSRRKKEKSRRYSSSSEDRSSRRKKDKSKRSSSSEDRDRSNRRRKEKSRRDSSSEDRSGKRKEKERKRYSSTESLDSISDSEKKKKQKSHRRRKDSSDSESDHHKKDKRDIDKKRKGKKKKRDRDRSPNYKKHRK